jgi:GT2 family glycosyltransferase
MTTSIVIPVFSRWDLLHVLLYDLYKNCSLIEEIVVVDNGNESKYPDVLSGLTWWQSTHMLPIEVVHLKENVGFLKASNIGLKAAIEDVVILISTDVRIQSDIIKALEIIDTVSDKWFAGGRLYNASTGWNDFDGRVFNYVEGWLLAGKKQTWEDLGYFDERYAPYDFEDVDISTMALEKGYILHSLELDCNISHIGAQTISYGDERETQTKKNRKVFEEKWLLR